MTLCRLVVLLGLVFTAGPATGQVFQKTYGSPMFDSAFGIAATADGGAVMVGRMGGTPPSLGLMLAKLDSRGDPRWVKSYTARAAAFTVQQTRDGGYILGGVVRVGSSTIDDAFLLRTDADGEPLWSAVYGAAGSTARVSAVIETADGGFAFAGSFGAPSGPSDAYIVRTDGRGNVVWARIYGGGASSLVATTDGGFLVVGTADVTATGNFEALVIKTDAAGMPIWSRVYGGAGNDWAVGAVEVSGGYLVAIGTQSFGAGGFDPALIRLDKLGSLLGGNTYGSPLSESPTSMVRTADGDVVIVGWTDGSMAPARGFALRTDEFGVLRWSKFFAASGFNAQAAAVDGGSWIVGRRSVANGIPMLVVKVNEDGATTCSDPDAGFVSGAMALVVGNGPASKSGPGTRSAGNVGAIVERLESATLCFCEGASRTTYGAGWPGTFGVPALVAFDRPVLGRTIALHAGNSLGTMTPGLLLLGRQPLDLVTPFDGRLLVQIELGLGVAVSANGAQVRLPIPNDTALCGTSLFAQVLEQDAGATKGVSFTPGLKLQFGM